MSIHVIVGLIWIAIGVTASYLPAARAARLDPSVALRDEWATRAHVEPV